jgi:hypothetical protein
MDMLKIYESFKLDKILVNSCKSSKFLQNKGVKEEMLKYTI